MAPTTSEEWSRMANPTGTAIYITDIPAPEFPDACPPETKEEEIWNIRQHNRAGFRQAASDQKHKAMARRHRQEKRAKKAESHRERARNKIRQINRVSSNPKAS